MSDYKNYDDVDLAGQMDLAEQVARLTARVAELEGRLARLENNPPTRPATPSVSSGEIAAPGVSGGDELVAGIRAVLERLGEAEAGEIRQELIKTGFPASLSRSDINKILYRQTALFVKVEGDEGKPEWALI